MPIYQFKCPMCGSNLEVMQSFTDEPPVCWHSESDDHKSYPVVMERVLSNTTFSLKGAGWAKDLYHKHK